MTNIMEEIWERFRNGESTDDDLLAIWNENEEQLAGNPRLVRCPDFDDFMRPQIERILKER